VLSQAISRTGRASLAIVGTFALLAVLLLTKVTLDSRGIASNVADAIDPQLSAVVDDTRAVPLLDTTATLTERISAAAEPIGTELNRTAASLAGAAGSTTGSAADVRSIRDNVADADASVAAITRSLTDQRPLMAVIAAQTGDIVAAAATMSERTDDARSGVDQALRQVVGITAEVTTVGGRVRAMPARLRGVAGHTENIEAADLLRRTELLRPLARH
jgi:hypothetical protein